MKTYQVQISHLGQKQSKAFQQGKSLKLKAVDNSFYQVLDSNGELVSIDKIAQIKQQNQDLLIFLDETSNLPDLVLEDYFTFQHIENISSLKSANVTFATVSDLSGIYVPVTASEVVAASSSSFSTTALYTLATLGAVGAVAGVALAAGGGKGGSSSDNTQKSVEKVAEEPTPAVEEKNEIVSEESTPAVKESTEIVSKEEPIPAVEENTEIVSEEEIPTVEENTEIVSEEEPTPAVEENTEIVSEEEVPTVEESTEIVSKEEPTPAVEENTEIVSEEESASIVEENIETVSEESPEPDINIEILTIAGIDNFINVTEAKAEKLLVQGKIFGADVSSNDTVKILVAGEEISATLNSDLTFSAEIEPKILLANQGYTVQAVVFGKNNAKSETEQSYTVAPNAIAQIDITDIDGNFSAYNDLGGITLLTGEVTLSGVFAQGKNTEALRQFEVLIGDKTYLATMHSDHKTFELKVPIAELAELDGESIQFGKTNTVYNAAKNRSTGNLVFRAVNEDISYTSLTLTGDYIANNGDGSYSIQLPEILMATITGTVSGVAKAGDLVEVVLNNTPYQTTVQDDLSFSIEVPALELAQNSTKTITATLMTKDLAGNEIEVSDIESYLGAVNVDSTYVQDTPAIISVATRKYNHLEQENPDEYNYPYFMAMFRGATTGFNKDIPMGGSETAVIRYHFVAGDEAEAKAQVLGIRIDSSNGEWADMDSKHQEMLREVFSKLESYLNVKFEYSDSYIEDQSGLNIFKGPYNSSSSGAAARNGSFVIFSTNESSLAAQQLWTNDNWFYYNAVHEILHTLDFGHTSDYFTSTANFAGMGAGELDDSTQFSYMSYNYGEKMGLGISGYDLAALHYRYGVNKNARSGDDVYTFQRFAYTEDLGGVYIWDGDGVDTFDASMEQERVYVNLNQGSWIYRGEQDTALAVKSAESYTVSEWFGINGEGTATRSIREFAEGQAFIGYGTQIENAIGSDYDDTLIGNTADNNLLGGKGNDILKGNAGNDYLDGGNGDDEMHGGEGNDTYVVDSTNDKVIENADEGVDTVLSLVDCTLGENVENLTLIGSVAKTAIGNELDNILIANNAGNTLNGGAGDDRLIGGLGEDIFIGGEGNDVFVFNTALNGNVDIIKDFAQGDKIELSQAIFTAIDKVENVMDYIRYDQTTGALSYQVSNSVDAIHFATIENLISLEQSSFLLG